MKKLTILLFSLLISFSSYGELKKIAKTIDDSGATYYIDTDTIKEHNGYVYWWLLDDFLKPDSGGAMSAKSYNQGDCGVNRFKLLSFIFYKQPMGREFEVRASPVDKWFYPIPESSSSTILNYACNYVK